MNDDTGDTADTRDTRETPDRRDAPGSKSERSFLHRVALVDGLAVIFLLALAALWYASHALLLIFACILFAILLYEASQRVRKVLPIRRPFALACSKRSRTIRSVPSSMGKACSPPPGQVGSQSFSPLAGSISA